MKPGTLVSMLDEDRKGVVLSLQGTRISVRWEDTGFEEWVEAHEVVEQTWHGQGASGFPGKDLEKPKKARKHAAPVPFVDLHATAMRDAGIFFRPDDTLRAQLEHARTELGKAQKSGAREMDFIHGVGEGILKRELHKWLAGKGLKFYDAPWTSYGEGATRVRLKP